MKLKLIAAISACLTAFPAEAQAVSHEICTREPGSWVALREGPGTNYSRGLVQVGSGGEGVVQYFESRNYTVPDGEVIGVFNSIEDTNGDVWHEVGTNQWLAWVRFDFVCDRQS